MTDDEIMLMADHTISDPVCLRVTSNEELLMFARAIESRTLTTQKDKWYQKGVEAEREACAKLIEDSVGVPNLAAHHKFEMYLKIFMQRVADQIRVRG